MEKENAMIGGIDELGNSINVERDESRFLGASLTEVVFVIRNEFLKL